ncbi:hypothetical protein C9374_004804 [Naegleria lovaniensis]|uniref:Transmembrane protein n=1 Tax=Naegleria lovaniensis TaxID=51637 RepID=A0AA88GR82_NAELO|nr:uncharacterized protein C9374_004804 [Naegleria lovaniensis]KAG2382837.1 hypothetical protein C9374_004804 [Naegleria lovaniensis]
MNIHPNLFNIHNNCYNLQHKNSEETTQFSSSASTSPFLLFVHASSKEQQDNSELHNHEEDIEDFNPPKTTQHHQLLEDDSTTTSHPSFAVKAFLTAFSLLCFLLTVILFVLLRLNEEDGMSIWEEEQELVKASLKSTSPTSSTSTTTTLRDHQTNVQDILPSRLLKQASMLLSMMGFASLLYAWTTASTNSTTNFMVKLWPYVLILGCGISIAGLIRIGIRYGFYLRKQEEERQRKSFSTRVKRFYV